MKFNLDTIQAIAVGILILAIIIAIVLLILAKFDPFYSQCEQQNWTGFVDGGRILCSELKNIVLNATQ